jgi:hypothetical protein
MPTPFMPPSITLRPCCRGHHYRRFADWLMHFNVAVAHASFDRAPCFQQRESRLLPKAFNAVAHKFAFRDPPTEMLCFGRVQPVWSSVVNCDPFTLLGKLSWEVLRRQGQTARRVDRWLENCRQVFRLSPCLSSAARRNCQSRDLPGRVDGFPHGCPYVLPITTSRGTSICLPTTFAGAYRQLPDKQACPAT